MPAALVPDPATPLWRAAQVFRLLSCLYALGFQIAINDELERPAIGWALFAVLISWSVACAAAYLHGYGRRIAWVSAEIVVVIALMLSTEIVASDQWALDNQSWPTTLWATNATISAAILLGPVGGMVIGLLVTASNAVLKGYVSIDVGRNATVVIELAVGLAIGMAAQTARRAHTELQRAARLAASLEERERLSREVHDGAIQVLALVARRGREIGGPTTELSELSVMRVFGYRRVPRQISSQYCAGAPPIGCRSAFPRNRSCCPSRWQEKSMRRWRMPWTTSSRTRARMPAPSSFSRTWTTRSWSASVTTAGGFPPGDSRRPLTRVGSGYRNRLSEG
jgi:hypothetical protein